MTDQLQFNYLCPSCRSYLRVWDNIIFTVRTNGTNKKKGILLLSPGLGNCNLVQHSSLKFEEGELVTFHCPVCSEGLTANEINENLARIILVDETNKEFDVYFSRICGQQSIFKIKEDDIIERFRKGSTTYQNYFRSKLKKKQVKACLTFFPSGWNDDIFSFLNSP